MHTDDLQIRFDFRRPDVGLAAINLRGDQVHGVVKGNLARLEEVPKPSTGYCFADVVKIEGPIGMTMIRDDQIPVYKAVEKAKASELPTFEFKAIVSSVNDWLDLSNVFTSPQTKVRYPWSGTSPDVDWHIGLCSANTIEVAEQLLHQFVASGKSRRVWDLIDSFRPSNVRKGEIDGTKATLELRYPKGMVPFIMLIGCAPIVLFLAVAVKVELHSTAEILAFVCTILLFVLVCGFLYNTATKRVVLNENGIEVYFPFTKQKRMTWGQVRSIRYSRNSEYMTLHSTFTTKIRIEKYLKGFHRFRLIAFNRVNSNTKT